MSEGYSCHMHGGPCCPAWREKLPLGLEVRPLAHLVNHPGGSLGGQRSGVTSNGVLGCGQLPESRVWVA